MESMVCEGEEGGLQPHFDCYCIKETPLFVVLIKSIQGQH